MRDLPDAVVLCGGAGLRLRAITGGRPKPLAEVAGRPFLTMLLAQLERFGFRRVILATGIGGQMIRQQFGPSFGDVDLVYSEEPAPLGTGGALRYAAPLVHSEDCLVMNGDSYTDAAIAQFARTHAQSQAHVSVVVVPADGRCDSGSIATDESGNVLEFLEKQGHGAGRYVNAGIYALRTPVLFEIPQNAPVSLERELFPAWIRRGFHIRAFLHCGKCVDIGTPERYEAAQSCLARAEAGTLRAGKGAL